MVKNLGTHLTEISAKDIFFSRSKSGRKVEGTGFRLLPSTNSFNIKLNDINPLLEYVKIERRMENSVEFEIHENAKRNRYARHCINRLKRLRNQPEKY